MRCLKLVFDRCFEAGVDIAICTDNAGVAQCASAFEYENLLTQDIIVLISCKLVDAAFRHVWRYSDRPATILTGLLPTTIQQNGEWELVERSYSGFRSQRELHIPTAPRARFAWLDTSLSQLHAGNLVVGRNRAYSGQCQCWRQ